MILNNPRYLAVLLIGGIVLAWLLFFAGPELFDQHTTLALLAAIAIYIGAPIALLFTYRSIRTSGKDET